MISKVPCISWVAYMLLLGPPYLHQGSVGLQKTTLTCWGAETSPTCRVLPWVPFEGVAEFHSFPWAFWELVFLPWEWIMQLGSWVSSKPQTNPSHSSSLNSDFPFPLSLVSSYFTAPLRLWLYLRGGEELWWGWAGMNADLSVCWLSCQRRKKVF